MIGGSFFYYFALLKINHENFNFLHIPNCSLLEGFNPYRSDHRFHCPQLVSAFQVLLEATRK